MNKLISSPKLWSWGIKHYLDQEPESIFVVEENNQIVGYVLGFLEEFKFDRKKAIVQGILRNLSFLYSLVLLDKIFWLDKSRESFVVFVKSFFSGRFREPKNAGHLHINLLPSVRGKNIGSELLNRFLSYAKKKGTKMVYANSYQRSEDLNSNFWIKNGFKEYSKISTTFWRTHIPDREIYLVCYIKKL